MIYPRVLFVNVATHVAAGLLVAVALWAFGGATVEGFFDWLWVGAALMLGGIMVQAVIHMRWLQAEEILRMPGRISEDAWLDRALRELLYFPFRSVFLSGGLWMLLGAAAAVFWSRATAAGVGISVAVYALILAIGACSALLQNFFYRQQIYPHLEAFIERLPDSGQRWVRARTLPFTVRAKLLLQGIDFVDRGPAGDDGRGLRRRIRLAARTSP